MADVVETQAKVWPAAISLLAEDEPYGRALAREIERHVRGEVFLYSRRQEAIAKDGRLVELFTRVFDHEAKVPVVLYREGWGQTRYTALEQDALRARRLREDPRSILVVTMDGGFPAAWYPPDLFRADARQFSKPQIAALVTERVKAAGGVVGPEPPVEKAKRIERERAELERLRGILRSEGPAALEQEASGLFCQIREVADAVTANGLEPMYYDERQRTCRVNYRWASLVCQWHRPIANSLQDASLAFSIKDAPTHLAGRHRSGEVRILESGTLEIDLPAEGLWGWRFRTLKPRRRVKKVLLTDELGDWLIDQLLDWTSGDKPKPRERRTQRRGGWVQGWRES